MSERQVFHDRGEQLLTVADIAGRVGAHEQTVRGWIVAGELKAFKLGSRIGYRIRLEDFEEYLNRRATVGAISRLLLGGLASSEAES
jgi:excisionase family DNA binding protein